MLKEFRKVIAVHCMHARIIRQINKYGPQDIPLASEVGQLAEDAQLNFVDSFGGICCALETVLFAKHLHP